MTLFGTIFKNKFFFKERRGDPLILKKISKFWGFLRLSRKVVKGSGLILAYSCSTRQDGNFDIAHDMIWKKCFSKRLNYNRVV